MYSLRKVCLWIYSQLVAGLKAVETPVADLYFKGAYDSDLGIRCSLLCTIGVIDTFIPSVQKTTKRFRTVSLGPGSHDDNEQAKENMVSNFEALSYFRCCSLTYLGSTLQCKI